MRCLSSLFDFSPILMTYAIIADLSKNCDEDEFTFVTEQGNTRSCEALVVDDPRTSHRLHDSTPDLRAAQK